MQAEWEEMARRNWISENQETPGQVTISTIEKVTPEFFIAVHPPVQIWDEPQLFQRTQENFLDMEVNFTSKSWSSLTACVWGRFGRTLPQWELCLDLHTA